ncbi:MAG: ABC transporter permease [Rubellimicrobium sp.]|nr:ABC transporter permease [Rubellimicrobium sp.]
MTTSANAATPAPLRRLGQFLRDTPIVALLVLLALLVGLLEAMSPGIVNPRWIGNTVKFAIPLAMLAASQTLTMYTGGIDLSAAAVATITGFVMATLVPHLGQWPALLIAMGPAVLVGLLNGLGTGVFRVHPLIMTLGSGLIGIGCLQVYQRYTIATGSEVAPLLEWLGTKRTGPVPNAVLVFVPFAAFVFFLERRTGFGRLLYAMGANERAARLSGLRPWQLHFALYVLSALIAGLTGLLYAGIIRTTSLSLAEPLLLPSVAAAVIGGTSIFGGRGSYSGTIAGALILTVLGTLLTLMQVPEGARRIVFGGIILAVTALYVRLTANGPEGER